MVLPILDKTSPSVFAALDVTLRRIGGAPTYVLTDNEKTVSIEHVAGIAVRNPAMVAFARLYTAALQRLPIVAKPMTAGPLERPPRCYRRPSRRPVMFGRGGR